MWSVANWPLYIGVFILQVVAGMWWIVQHAWPKGAQATVDAVLMDGSSLIITAGGLSLVLTELWTSVPRWAVLLCRRSTQLRRWLVRKLGRDVIEAEQKRVIDLYTHSLEEAVQRLVGGTHGSSTQDR